MPSAIEDYALIGDLHTAALAGRDGSIDWLCLPRFDAPACFAALLGDERHGRWRIVPAAHGAATRRSYAGDSLVLHTEWDTAEGTVRALTYAPTGGIVAAATTSLPEEPGGRLRAIAGDPADLQTMYGRDGTRRIPESTVDWLPGYRGGSPVRIGNAAARQRQLDVWGEVLDGLHVTRESGIVATDTAWDRRRDLLEHLEGHWREPDSSLWEVRGEEQQYVHSKVMAWAGFDRAVRTVQRLGLPGPVDAWRRTRAAIHAEVCERGFDSERNTFTQCYGSARLDAALQLIPRIGFLPYDDPRVIGTIDAVQRELSRDGLLMRYRDGREGAFVACSFWLVEALNGIGRDQEAHELLERLLALRNDVGMLAEECDPASGRHLGNTPQAFSLVGLVNAARCLPGARTGRRPPGRRR
ncbi:glycoside hydrolase family 15 protein [Dactylosporangium sp. CA-139114]|uniref:glycoside hydrolase family 15 protein n=1 Tax=Dactylosporangium sp. CA-139114 TaxID=3239931 RepID=UPI003D960D5D